MIPVRFDGFSAILRLEKFEIHNVVLHVACRIVQYCLYKLLLKPELSISIIDKIQISGKHNEKKGACHDKE